MKILLMLILSVVAVGTLHAAEPIDLFNGKPLDGWTSREPYKPTTSTSKAKRLEIKHVPAARL